MKAAAPFGSAPSREPIGDFSDFGVVAFSTTRFEGDYGLDEADARPGVLERWQALQEELAPVAPRLASARQAHGTRILEHGAGWQGWLRVEGFDGHMALDRGIALAVTVADCVAVFIAHPSGAVGLLHAGWRGTAGGIIGKAIGRLRERGVAAQDLRLHLGPAICGRCYEVGPDVFEQLTGWSTIRHRHVDLRALLAEQAKEAGVGRITASPFCPRCDNDRFFSHRAGDQGRQLGVIVSPVP